jgi:hypothetical protein
MPSYVARPHVLTDEFVPGYLGDSCGGLPEEDFSCRPQFTVGRFE